MERDDSVDEMAEHHRRRHLRDDFVGGERARLAREHGPDTGLRERQRGGIGGQAPTDLVEHGRQLTAQRLDRRSIDGRAEPVAGHDVVEELRQRRGHGLSMPPEASTSATLAL